MADSEQADGGRPPALPGTRAPGVPPGGVALPGPDVARVRVDRQSQIDSVIRLADLHVAARVDEAVAGPLRELLARCVAQLGGVAGLILLLDAGAGEGAGERPEAYVPVAAVGLDGLDAPALSAAVRAAWDIDTRLERARAESSELRETGVDACCLEASDLAGLAGTGIRSACSLRLVTAGDEPVGTLAVFYDQPARPAAAGLRSIESPARLLTEILVRGRLFAAARDTAAAERRRSEQLRQLASAALELSRTGDLRQVLRVVTGTARDIVGAHYALTSRLPPGWTDAVTFVSLSDKYAAWRGYDEVPKGLGGLDYVTRENRPLRCTSAELLAHDDWRGRPDAPGHPPLPDYLAAPLVARDGSNLGLIQLSDKYDGTPFTAEDEAILVQLAQAASAAVEALEAFAAERAARAEAERTAYFRTLLSEAGAVATGSLDETEILRRLVELPVPHVFRACTAWLHDGESLRVVARADSGAAAGEGPAGVDWPPVPATSGLPAARAFASCQPVFVPDLVADTASRPRDAPRWGSLFEQLNIGAAYAVPLHVAGETLGALEFSRDRGAPLPDDDELELCRELAARAAAAVGAARRYQQERRAAELLQRSLLPRLPELEEVEVAARYRPGSSGIHVGGDWYDVIDLGAGRTAITVGDVMGRGLHAASVMGQLRSAVRAFALLDLPPGQVLTLLDALVEELPDAAFVTCCYGVHDPAAARVTLAVAGHPPPLHRASDGTVQVLRLEADAPLGAGRPFYREQAVTLHGGDVLLLYTDGLVEDRERDLDVGLQQLAERLATATATDLGALSDALLPSDSTDDVAILLVSPTGIDPAFPHPPQRVLAVDLDRDPRSVARGRQAVATAAEGWGLPRDVVDVAQLLVSELATNAIRHGQSPIRVRVRCTGRRLYVEVADGGPYQPRRRQARATDEGGRGLELVDVLAQRWGTRPSSSGKVVWLELDLGGPIAATADLDPLDAYASL